MLASGDRGTAGTQCGHRVRSLLSGAAWRPGWLRGVRGAGGAGQQKAGSQGLQLLPGAESHRGLKQRATDSDFCSEALPVWRAGSQGGE